MPKQEASRARERGKTARDKQLQRAQDRQKKFGPQKTVTPSNVQNITLLESMTVSSTRRETYVQAWDTFTQFVKTSRLKIVTVEQLDGAAVWWIDHLYFQGENVASVMTFMAAVKYFRSDVSRMSDLSRAFKGFKKIPPSSSAYPMLALIALHILTHKRCVSGCSSLGICAHARGKCSSPNGNTWWLQTPSTVFGQQSCPRLRTRRGRPCPPRWAKPTRV